MVQIKILSGKQAGVSWTARRFPVHIGRAAESDLQLEEPGVFDDHLTLSLDASEGFHIETKPGALVSVNHQPVERSPLRNGDTIEIGALKLQFWMSTPVQRGLKIREAFVWATITAVCAGQIALIYWLLRSE